MIWFDTLWKMRGTCVESSFICVPINGIDNTISTSELIRSLHDGNIDVINLANSSNGFLFDSVLGFESIIEGSGFSGRVDMATDNCDRLGACGGSHVSCCSRNIGLGVETRSGYNVGVLGLHDSGLGDRFRSRDIAVSNSLDNRFTSSDVSVSGCFDNWLLMFNYIAITSGFNDWLRINEVTVTSSFDDRLFRSKISRLDSDLWSNGGRSAVLQSWGSGSNNNWGGSCRGWGGSKCRSYGLDGCGRSQNGGDWGSSVVHKMSCCWEGKGQRRRCHRHQIQGWSMMMSVVHSSVRSCVVHQQVPSLASTHFSSQPSWLTTLPKSLGAGDHLTTIPSDSDDVAEVATEGFVGSNSTQYKGKGGDSNQLHGG